MAYDNFPPFKIEVGDTGSWVDLGPYVDIEGWTAAKKSEIKMSPGVSGGIDVADGRYKPSILPLVAEFTGETAKDAWDAVYDLIETLEDNAGSYIRLVDERYEPGGGTVVATWQYDSVQDPEVDWVSYTRHRVIRFYIKVHCNDDPLPDNFPDGT